MWYAKATSGEVKFALPMIQILDEEHHAKTGEIRFVKCAVLADTADHWTVKPVEKPHYDPEEMFDKNQRFDQALAHLWRVTNRPSRLPRRSPSTIRARMCSNAFVTTSTTCGGRAANPPGNSATTTSKQAICNITTSMEKHVNIHTTNIVLAYSFTGGVGRTTAVVQLGYALAKRGKGGPLVDFDLRDPNVTRYLAESGKCSFSGSDAWKTFPGVVDSVAHGHKELGSWHPGHRHRWAVRPACRRLHREGQLRYSPTSGQRPSFWRWAAAQPEGGRAGSIRLRSGRCPQRRHADHRGAPDPACRCSAFRRQLECEQLRARSGSPVAGCETAAHQGGAAGERVARRPTEVAMRARPG